MPAGKQTPSGRAGNREHRYYFFLNPYDDQGFTRCPKCEGKTRLRKFCLVIHIEPGSLISFNKTCKFCPGCELIIVKRTDLESYLVAICEQQGWTEIIGNDYLVIGTLDRKLHRQGKGGNLTPKMLMGLFAPFANHLAFEIRGGWMPEEG